MSNKRFGEIDKFIFIGGGSLLFYMVEIVKKYNKDILVITTKKQLQEIIHKTITRNNSSFKNCLQNKRVNYLSLKSLKNNNRWYKEISNNTIGISCRSRWIFNERDIKRFKNKLINTHSQVLPAIRGAGGLSWNIMLKYFLCGQTIHLVDKGIDTGPIIMQSTYSFPKKIQNSLEKMNNYCFAKDKKLILKFIKKLLNKSVFKMRNQKKSLREPSYWPRLDTKKNGWINWAWKASDIVKFIKAFSSPYTGTSTYLINKKISFKKAKLANSNYKFHPFQNGLVYDHIGNKLFVACDGGGVVLILDKRTEDKFKNDFVGKRLITPSNILEKALQKKKIIK